MADQNKVMTVIGPDAQIKGEVSFNSPACILGEVDGSILGKGEITIGEGAHCKASVEGTIVTIDGTVEGDISATERLQLNASARVTGDLVAQTMSIAEGASFVGHCRVGATASKVGNSGIENKPRVTGGGGSGNPNIADLRAKIAGLAHTKSA